MGACVSNSALAAACIGGDGGSWRPLCPGGLEDAGALLSAMHTIHTHTDTHTHTHTHVHAQKASQLLGPAACQLGRQRMYRDTWTFTQHMYNAWQVGWTVLRSTSRLDPAVVVYKKYIYFWQDHTPEVLTGRWIWCQLASDVWAQFVCMCVHECDCIFMWVYV